MSSATLADLNSELIAAYRVVAGNTENLIKLLKQHHSKHEKGNGYYYKMRSRCLSSDLHTAARFIYLNKTCFNGLYRVNKRGFFNTSEGNYKNPNICDEENLRRVAAVLKGVRLKSGDFEKTVQPQRGDFVYCDPPYYATYNDYQPDRFHEADHLRLRAAIARWSRCGARIMLSNSDSPFIRKLYSDYDIVAVSANRLISCNGARRGKKQELIVRNYS